MSERPDIALVGKAGAGKSTVAEILVRGLGYEQMAIAGLLKDIAALLWGENARTDRDKLQRLGVAVRAIREDTWIDALIRQVGEREQLEFPPPVVVDDCRFPNEYWRLKEEGFVVVRITAPRSRRITRLQLNGKLQDESQLEHESETALDDYEADYTIKNDDTMDGLIEQIKEVLFKEVSRT